MTRSARSRLHKNFDLDARLSQACSHIVFDPTSWHGRWKTWSTEASRRRGAYSSEVLGSNQNEVTKTSAPFKRLHLDLGCGKGEWTLHSAQEHPETLVVGIDTEIICALYSAEKATRAHCSNLVITCEFDQNDASFMHAGTNSATPTVHAQSAAPDTLAMHTTLTAVASDIPTTPAVRPQVATLSASTPALTPRDKSANKLLVSEPNLRAYFAPGELNEISLNFPTPHPKKKRAQLRLTTAERLTLYQELLDIQGELLLRTDSQPLFDYTLIQLRLAEWDITWQTSDYHREMNVAFESEYEHRLREEGACVFALRAHPRRIHAPSEIRARITHTEPQSLFDYLPENLDEMTYIPHGMQAGVFNLRNKRRRSR